MKFNIITYIKPTDNFNMFVNSLANVQKFEFLNKLIISFVDELSNDFKKELDKYENITWKDNVDEYWLNKSKIRTVNDCKKVNDLEINDPYHLLCKLNFWMPVWISFDQFFDYIGSS